MKKVLLGTSAIALAGAFSTPADAVEWTVRVGGYMEQYIAYADTDLKKGDFLGAPTTVPTGAATPNGDFDGIDSKQDAEIHFLPSITLDNGLQFGANIQLEGNTSGDQIDESYMFIDGSFGEINLGNENSAGYKMTYGAPDVTFLGVNSGSLTKFIPFSGTDLGADVFRGTLGSSFVENVRNNDAARFTYYTPRFAGFQVGVSYARDGADDSSTQMNTNVKAGTAPPAGGGGPLGTVHDIFDVGANYVNSFGDFNVALSGRYGTADIEGASANPDVWAVGLNLGYAGFTVGGSYARQDDTGAYRMDGEYFDVGASYETGPWGFSFTFARGENAGNENAGDEVLKQYLLGVSYALAKGVTLNGYGAYVDFYERNSPKPPFDELDGWVVGTGVKISF